MVEMIEILLKLKISIMNNQLAVTFINTTPNMIEAAAKIRRSPIGSCKKNIPIRNAPIAPIPTQIVYAVPRGKVLIAAANRPKLKIMKTIVIILGVSFVKPSDIFIENAQTISNIPAKIK